MKGILGYGRYNDAPEHVGCPRAKTDMTPCIARDGYKALSDGYYDERRWVEPVCVGCGEAPRPLLHALAQEFQPARRYMQTKDANACADRLTDLVRDATAPNTESKP